MWKFVILHTTFVNKELFTSFKRTQMSLPGKVTKNICNKTESCWYQWRNCVSFVIDHKCYKCYLVFGCLVFVNAIMWEHRFSNQIKLIEANYFAEWLWLRQFRMTETTFESWCNDIGSVVRPVIQSHDLLRKSHLSFLLCVKKCFRLRCAHVF